LKIVATTPTNDGDALLTLQMTLPWEVVEDLSETLELAARLTGNEKMGALIQAITSECRSSWLPQIDLARPKKLGGVDI